MVVSDGHKYISTGTAMTVCYSLMCELFDCSTPTSGRKLIKNVKKTGESSFISDTQYLIFQTWKYLMTYLNKGSFPAENEGHVLESCDEEAEGEGKIRFHLFLTDTHRA